MKIENLFESSERKLEGHWYSEREPHFPMPVHSDEEHPKKAEILKAYDDLLSKDEFNYASGKSNPDNVRGYRGLSPCRCCNDRGNGCLEYEHNGYIWPQGFRHYIDDHNIIPSKEFLKDVLGIEV